jgi:hypothetical protein
MGSEGPLVDPHQAGLADGRHRLQGDGVLRALAVEADRRQPGGDRAGGDEHHDVARGPQVGGLGAQLRHGGLVDVTQLVGDRRRPHLHDQAHVSRPRR